MANFPEWSIGVLRRSVGVFIASTTGALIGLGTTDATGLVEIGAAGWQVSDPDFLLAALATGLGAAITDHLYPAAKELAAKLKATPKEDLEI